MLQPLKVLFPDATLEDLKLYLQGCLVLAQTTTETAPSLRHISDVYSEDGRRGLVLTDYESKTDTKVALKDVLMSLWFPQDGWFSFRKTAVHLSRIPWRQNRKGICDSTVSLRNLSSLLWGSLRDVNVPSKTVTSYGAGTTPYELWSLICPKQPRYQRLDNQKTLSSILESGIVGRALSPQFAVSRGHDCAAPTIWFGLHPIASVSMDDPSTILVREKYFHQECLDFFLPQGFEVTV